MRCDLGAYTWLAASAEQLAELRRKPGPGPGVRLAPSFLKHADEQTVVALAAVCEAADRHGFGDASFADWAVVAAPRALGAPRWWRPSARYKAEGAWGISPNLIPHRSPHAVSGTISQALRARPEFRGGRRVRGAVLRRDAAGGRPGPCGVDRADRD